MATDPLEDADKVSGFISGLLVDFLKGDGLKLSILELPGVIAAGKRLPKGGGVDVLRKTMTKIEAKHPEVWEIILAGASATAIDKIRKWLGAKPDIETQAERVPEGKPPEPPPKA